MREPNSHTAIISFESCAEWRYTARRDDSTSLPPSTSPHISQCSFGTLHVLTPPSSLLPTTRNPRNLNEAVHPKLKIRANALKSSHNNVWLGIHRHCRTPHCLLTVTVRCSSRVYGMKSSGSDGRASFAAAAFPTRPLLRDWKLGHPRYQYRMQDPKKPNKKPPEYPKRTQKKTQNTDFWVVPTQKVDFWKKPWGLVWSR